MVCECVCGRRRVESLIESSDVFIPYLVRDTANGDRERR